MPNEHQLIAALQQGEATAFKSLVLEHERLVFNTALGIVQSNEDAEDVAQEVFIQVYESIKNFKGEAKISTWLYRIAITKSLDLLRRKKRKKRVAFVQSLFGINNEVQYDPPDFFHPGVQLDNKERSAVLFRAIGQLPENQKIAFTLHKVEGLSYQHIGEIMNTSLAAVESYMHRAKQNLKKTLSIYYEKN